MDRRIAMNILDRFKLDKDRLVLTNPSGILHDNYNNGEYIVIESNGDSGLFVCFNWGDYFLILKNQDKEIKITCTYDKTNKYKPCWYLGDKDLEFILKNAPKLVKRWTRKLMMEELTK